MTSFVTAEIEAVKTEITDLLGTVTIASLRRIKARLEKKKLKRSHMSGCKPRSKPLIGWKPKHKVLTKEALKLIRSGAGLKSAPFVVGSNGWQYKFFAADVAQGLLHNDNEGPIDDERAVMAKSSITVSSLTARIVEEANFLKATDPDSYGSAQLQMQSSREDAGWSKATTRGSGVVMNEAGKGLFASATEQIAMRILS